MFQDGNEFFGDSNTFSDNFDPNTFYCNICNGLRLISTSICRFYILISVSKDGSICESDDVGISGELSLPGIV